MSAVGDHNNRYLRQV
uniref:Uncharacterized protein n=1 Tax=Arundo donax TaxID=35708 RepID=A0A0A9BXR6_ARUDO